MERWTFGRPSEKTGYMEIASKRVHRIVAMGFLGQPPTNKHVVDHIDTNRQNNRPDNLRWVTRLENVLLNPITVQRIEFACGCSVEEFLDNPSKYRDEFQEPNYKWMCTVSEEEAKSSLERMLDWAKSDKTPSVGSLGAWIFNRNNTIPKQTGFYRRNKVDTSLFSSQAQSNNPEFAQPEIPTITESLTPNAVQHDWRTPSEFPCCPQEYTEEPIRTYTNNLVAGSVFCRNDLYSSLVLKSSASECEQTIHVISKSTEEGHSVKPLALARITFENGKYVHTSLGTFFSQEGAEKQFHLAQGFAWHGGDSIDDYC